MAKIQPMTQSAERLETGMSAPDVEILDATGKAMMLSSLWQQRRTLVSFLRHFG
jgi:peroxiredoxin